MYDVIVVGAGPAGGMASYTIASKGFSVLVMEKKKEIGKPVQCGEGITKFCLENVGLSKGEWIKWKVKGIKSILPGGYYFYTREAGYSIDRAYFDKWLIDKAMDEGAELVNERAKRIQGKAGNWKIEGNKKEYRGKILIGADGPPSNIARQMGLLKNRKFLFGYQYKFRAADMEFDDEWFHIYWGEEFKGGYGWVFPRGDEYNIGVGGIKANINQLKNFCKYLKIDVTKKIEMNKGVIPFNYNFISRGEKGIMIVGDAAGMTNPISGGGIHAALASGKLAGEIAVKAMEKEDVNITIKYDKKIKNTPFLNPVHLKGALYLQKWKQEDWKFLGKIMHKKDFSELTLWKSFVAGLKNPKYLLRGKEMLLIRKAMKINQKYGW